MRTSASGRLVKWRVGACVGAGRDVVRESPGSMAGEAVLARVVDTLCGAVPSRRPRSLLRDNHTINAMGDKTPWLST